MHDETGRQLSQLSRLAIEGSRDLIARTNIDREQRRRARWERETDEEKEEEEEEKKRKRDAAEPRAEGEAERGGKRTRHGPAEATAEPPKSEPRRRVILVPYRLFTHQCALVAFTRGGGGSASKEDPDTAPQAREAREARQVVVGRFAFSSIGAYYGTHFPYLQTLLDRVVLLVMLGRKLRQLGGGGYLLRVDVHKSRLDAEFSEPGQTDAREVFDLARYAKHEYCDHFIDCALYDFLHHSNLV